MYVLLHHRANATVMLCKCMPTCICTEYMPVGRAKVKFQTVKESFDVRLPAKIVGVVGVLRNVGTEPYPCKKTGFLDKGLRAEDMVRANCQGPTRKEGSAVKSERPGVTNGYLSETGE